MTEFDELLDETLTLFGSMSHKIMEGNPTWAELDNVLTDKERLIFDAFVTATTSPQVPPEVGP